jgi:hypothetical protein
MVDEIRAITQVRQKKTALSHGYEIPGTNPRGNAYRCAEANGDRLLHHLR